MMVGRVAWRGSPLQTSPSDYCGGSLVLKRAVVTMNYQQALDYLYSFLDSERKLPRAPLEFNLPRTAALLAALGAPQHAFRSVVIAGTKGKGSTAALLEAIVRASGLRTGLWTSPHLHSYRERIQVNRRLISQDELIRAVEMIQPEIAAFAPDPHGV